MTASVIQELYNSPNGDRWALCKDHAGNLVVSHQPNHASGGHASQIGVATFLSQHGTGPEYQALIEALARQHAEQQGSGDVEHKLCRALAQAVAQLWKTLPQEIQHDLFEAALAAEGDAIRQPLSIYLQGKHEHTLDAAQPRAVPEPDSLGG